MCKENAVARLRSCPYCGRVHSTAHDCGKKPKREKKQTRESRFRSSGEWTRTSLAIRARDAFCCLACLNGWDDSPRINAHGTQVHHIIALHEDFDRRTDEDNLITLCQKHHEEAEAGEIPKETLVSWIKLREEAPA